MSINRTRLDEIIDEETSGGAWLAGEQIAKRIAERAFRHGVERHAMSPVCLVDARCVQPAPAEEKVTGHGCSLDGCGWPRDHSVHTGISSGHPFRHLRNFCRLCDRRKGERRKWHEIRGTLGLSAHSYLWMLDRRYGPDRRKP